MPEGTPPDEPPVDNPVQSDVDTSSDQLDGTIDNRQIATILATLPLWTLIIAAGFYQDFALALTTLDATVIAEEYDPAPIGFMLVTTAIAVGLIALLKRRRNLDRGPEPIATFPYAVTIGAVPFWLIGIFYAYTQQIPRALFGVLFLGGILLLYITWEYPDSESRVDQVGLLVSAAVTVIVTAYLVVHFNSLYQETLGRATDFELVLAGVFTLVMIYLTWRSFGPTFLAVVLGGIGYGLFGEFIPGVLGHGGISPGRTLRILVVSMDGFYGFLTQLVAAWIALFLLYAGLLKAYGAFDLILRLAMRSAKYIDSGIAQTAVVASAIIGSVNGSQTANAGMTGSFTIPLMKENGVKPETAGGIEAVASTAGQVLPPVMGAGAFIMASLITGVSYVDVVTAGLIPATILVVSIFVAVHYVAAPQVIQTDPSEMIQDPMSRGELLFDSAKYGIPLFVLIYLLGVLQWTVMTSALWTALSMILCGVFVPMLKDLYEGEGVGQLADTLLDGTERTISGFRQGVIVLAPVAIILAAINGVVDILMATGVPTAISLALMDLSGGVMIIAVILAMVICILLGLGMPTTAAYTVVALLIAPTLINQFAVPHLASHFFVFYAAILAGLTPPIATAVAVTTGIAGSDFWKTCKEAVKISAPLYVLPFAFVYHPELVSGELAVDSFVAGGLAMLGAIAIIHGINYHFTFGRGVTVGARVVFFALGVVAMVYPDFYVQMAAVTAIVVLYVVQTSIGKPDPIAALRGFADNVTGRERP